MPKKRTDDFDKLPIAEQQEEIDRFYIRKAVRKANRQLAKDVAAWVTDLTPEIRDEFMELFEAAGHEGEYHETPQATTQDRVMILAARLTNIIKRLEDTPLDYSGALELSYVYQRIEMAINKLAATARGTMADAIRMYRQIGEIIRKKVYVETGHYPEDFPLPRGRMTGLEKPDQFKLRDHQPRLFVDEE